MYPRTCFYALTLYVLPTEAARVVSPTTVTTASMHTSIKGSNEKTNVVQKDGAEEPAYCEKKTSWIQSSNDIDKDKESKQSLWRRIVGFIFPDIYQAQVRFEEYEAGIYRRIEESKSDTGQVGGTCEFLRGVGENKTEKWKTNR